MDVKQKQIEFLERFISGDMGVIERDYLGLCGNIDAYSGEYIGWGVYYRLVESWPDKARKDAFYPTSAQLSSIPKYEGEQLRLRISLAKHLLEGLRG